MYNAPALKKALQIIKLIVRENKPLGVTEVARTLALSKSTTFGILKSLEEEGFVVKANSTKKYVAGGELLELSKWVLRASDLTNIARPFLERLVEQVEETAFLGVQEDEVVKVIDVVEPQAGFKISSPVGARFALTAGVIGKVFLSPLGNEEILAFLSRHKLPQYTESSIVDPVKFLEEIERTRASGYAVDLEEYLTGMRAVAKLIYSGRLPVGAIWVVGFTSSLNDDRLPHVIEHVKQTSEEISLRLSPFYTEKDKQ